MVVCVAPDGREIARGLANYSALEGVLLDTMYEIPSQSEVSKVVIDESVERQEKQRGPKAPSLTRTV